jgi:predicted nucleotidyltransferase component of viral defense system
MSKGSPNVAASVRARLANITATTGDDYNLLLVRYGLERFLYRLGESKHKGSFVLKGALLFSLWGGTRHRATRDLDLLGFGDSEVAHLITVIKEVCQTPVSDDGVVFDPESVRGEEIRTIDEYGGVRINLRGNLGTAIVAVQIDIGFGDAMTPPPLEVSYPTLIEMPKPVIRVYSQETVIAEKTEAIVKLGMLNTRFKDYFDLHFLATGYSFDGPTLAQAMTATFARRGTSIPAIAPVGLTETFSTDANKLTQWTAFLRRGRVPPPDRTFPELVAFLASFLLPPLVRPLSTEFKQRWSAGGSWSA